jgi:hypothetical protein
MGGADSPQGAFGLRAGCGSTPQVVQARIAAVVSFSCPIRARARADTAVTADRVAGLAAVPRPTSAFLAQMRATSGCPQ